MPRLLIIIASTRPGRIGLPVAHWCVQRAAAHGGFELDVVDLAELPAFHAARAPLRA